jgi:hypothetical protein
MKHQQIGPWSAKRQLLNTPLSFLDRLKKSEFDAYNFRLNSEYFFLCQSVGQLPNPQTGKREQEFFLKSTSQKNSRLDLAELSISVDEWLSTLQKYLGVTLTQHIEQQKHASIDVDKLFGAPMLWSLFHLTMGVDLRRANLRDDQAVIRLIDDLKQDLHCAVSRLIPSKHSLLSIRGYRLRRKLRMIESHQSFQLSTYQALLEWYSQQVDLLTWSLIFLDQYPEINERLKKENSESLKDRPYTVESLHELPHLLCFILEVLRLTPPHWLCRSGRVSDSTLRALIPVDQYTQSISNATLLISPYLNHRNAEEWPSPLSFEIGRFQAVAHGQNLPESYMPFGLGRQGEQLLRAAIHTCAAALSSLFRRGDYRMSSQCKERLTEITSPAGQWQVEEAVGVNFGAPSDLKGQIKMDPRFVYIPSARV